jgi:hypothetical protein
MRPSRHLCNLASGRGRGAALSAAVEPSREVDLSLTLLTWITLVSLSYTKAPA